jgi:alpha-L-arabinofuranosidase
MAVTLMNRHRFAPADVCIAVGQNTTFSSAWVDALTAETPAAMNTVEEPDRVVTRRVAVTLQRNSQCRLELPPHSMATLRLARHGYNSSQ